MTSSMNPNQSLSFDDVSKLFSLPLSESADILGISTSALKKICNDNGLERWPHRKYLAGKSIEEIIKETAKEKSKALGASSPADRQKSNNVLTSPGSHMKDKTPKSLPEISKSQSSTAQQPGNRSFSTWRSHHMLASGLAIDATTFLDEFKYGFPSTGLSRSTNKWWGSGLSNGDQKTGSKVKCASQEQVDDSSAKVCEEKADSVMGDSSCVMEEKISLSGVGKRALDEGYKALKQGAWKRYGADKLGKNEKILLHRLFQTSFGMDGSVAVSLSDD